MKSLLFSDLHGNINFFNLIKEKSANSDIIICSGDISHMGNDLNLLVSRLNSFKKQVLILHGNHEQKDELRDVCNEYENVTFIHKAVHIQGENLFMGFGGGGFSLTDPEFSLVANRFFKKQDFEKMKRLVLITHAPPFKTKLDLIMGEHRGNKSIRQFIDEVQPHLVVCGHLHEHAGKYEKIGRSLIINPGPEGMIVEI
ncbi:metallophosphoesterase family protein [Candidatus Woesearchaeota archaeon]|nr:metallophosphoesterase family protein [Candidatus Woesearchaeota archaeon]